MTGRLLLAMSALCLATACCAAPVALTSGPGDDTEAAWSPDGSRIAFQREIDGDVDLCVLDLGSGGVTTLIGGPGHAVFPCWSPDGQTIVYAFARFTHTAAEGIEDGYNLFAVSADGGEPHRLTEGLFRDYTPAFTPEGDALLFSTTRGLEQAGATLARVPFEGGEPIELGLERGRDIGFVEPALSPDGSLICCSHVRGLRSNWTLALLQADAPTERFALSGPEEAMYAPSWSPDGRLIACTGYRPGDPGWGIYVTDAASGRSMRLDLGPGNCRSPVWSPDGGRLVFESNRSGNYHLFSVDVPELRFPPTPTVPENATVLALEFDPRGATVRDSSPRDNSIQMTGAPAIGEDAITFERGQFVSAEAPRGLSFGDGPFAVVAEMTPAEITGEVQIVAVGDYPQHHQGWQLYISDEGYLWFNSRDTEGTFKGARSDEPLEQGRRVSAVGLRRAGGRVELWIDGRRQHRSSGGATMRYADAGQVRIGSQYSGGMDFVGTLHALSILDRAPAPATIRAPHLKEFVSQ